MASFDSTFKSDRLTFFSDGVMAVAITILVLDLKIPEHLGPTEFQAALAELWQGLWCYVLSFVVIGVLWIAHHRQYAHIERVDGVLLWLNLVFLMAVALIPFVTKLMSDYGGPLPVALYAGVLTVTSLALTAMWWYAARKGGLMEPDVPLQACRAGILTPLLLAIVFATSIGIAFAVGASEAQWSWLVAAAAGPVGDWLSRA
jgi:uncharacterized membrane protein